MRVSPRSVASDVGTLQVRVVGPESGVPTNADLRRLFASRALTRSRRERAARCAKVLASYGARVVGMAAFDRTADEIRVHEIAFEPDVCFSPPDILRHLLDALELACLASGGRRLVLLPHAVVAVTPLERLGYHLVNEGCAGAWLEKSFL
jgi:hypothetical protein